MSTRQEEPAMGETTGSASETRPIPGVIAYLASKDAPAAIEFYKKAFGAEEKGRMMAEDGKRVMHCELAVNGSSLMLGDCFPEYGFGWQQPTGTTLTLVLDDATPWYRRAVDAGCTVKMPLEVAFWGDLYGQVTDPFGHDWAFVSQPPQG